MIKVRQSIFQTNSSSSHSLSIGKPADRAVIDDKNITITVGSGGYSWGYELLTKWYEKADYFGVEAVTDDRKKRLKDVLKYKYPNCEIEFNDNGYIDHQSTGTGWDEVESGEDLYDIIFGDSVIEIDNDNR